MAEVFAAALAELEGLGAQVDHLLRYAKQLEGYSQRIVQLAERIGIRPKA
jgi:hypothetical protein